MIVNGIEMLGLVSNDSYSEWLVGGSKMIVYQPRFIAREIGQPGAIQTPDGQPRLMIKITPITILSTSQERVSVNPSVVDILARLEEKDDSTVCSPYSDIGNVVGLYSEYIEAVRTWKMAIGEKCKSTSKVGNNDVIDMFKGKH